MSDQGAAPAPAKGRWLILSGLWLLYLSFGVGMAGLAPLVQTIIEDLGLSHGGMGAILGAWQFVYIFSAIPCGLLLSKIGSRWALAIGACLIAASGFLRSISVDQTSLLIAVGIFGLGGPIISAGAPHVTARWFKGPERGFAMGIYVTGPPLGATLVLLLTNSVLMPYFGDDWRLVLRLWAWVGVLAAVYWLVVATFCGRRAARAGQTTEVSGIGFLQLRELLSLREVQLVLLISIGAFMFNHGLYNWLPEMLRINGLTPVQAGYWATIPVVIGVVSALIVPRQAIPAHRITVLAGLFAIAGCAAVLLSVDLAAIRLLALVMQGIAGGTMMTVLMLTLVELKHVGPDKAGLAGGLFFSVAEIGGVGGPVMFGVLYDVTGTFHSGLYMLALFTIIMLILASRLRPFIEP